MDTSESQIQITLVTKQEINAVPGVPLTVPSSIECHLLNELVNQLLKENRADYVKTKEFDFLVFDELLRVPLIDHLTQNNVSTETTITVEYIERTPAPEPQDSVLHDDWVSGVHCCNKWIVTGCYDNSVNLWTTHGKLVVSSKEHSNIVKKVAWINPDDPSKGLVSVSHDLTGIIWSWEVGTNNLQPEIALRGHSKSLDSVGISPDSQKLATGGWDTTLKIWATSLESDDEPDAKKGRGVRNLITRTPIHTVEGHKESITGIEWLTNTEICTVSMDHTIKFWDVELYGIKHEIVGQKAFLSASWSPLSNTLLASSADRHIRLYDPRASEGTIVKTTFTSHNLWVPAVKWSKYSEFLFASGSYDSCVKVWDSRSPKTPLYDLQGHEGQVLGVDWSNPKYIVSGGTDNQLHIFKNKDIA